MLTLSSRTLSIAIRRPARRVYDFAADPRNFPKWARGLGRTVQKAGRDWLVRTPRGTVKVRMARRNSFGVLDHTVVPAPGTRIYVPMRVVPNGDGSEVLFTLFRQPGVGAGAFSKDIALVRKDLNALKNHLERARR